MEKKGHFCEKLPQPVKREYERSERVTEVLRAARNLTGEETVGLVCALVKGSRLTPANICGLVNFIRAHGNKAKASEQPRMVDSRAPSTSTQDPKKDMDRKETISVVPHNQVSLIVRSDLIQEGAALAFDTEKLVLHVAPKKTHNFAGDFALVDMQGRAVIWCYIFQKDICAYNTEETGLTKEKIESGITVAMFQEILNKVLKRNVLVGAAVKEDFKDLGLDINHLPGESTFFDIQDFFQDKQRQKVSLAQLTEHMTGQPFQVQAHSSLADARMTAMAYKRMLRYKDNGFELFDCPDFDEFQEEKKKEKKNKHEKRWERCRCFDKPPKWTSVNEWGNAKKLPGF